MQIIKTTGQADTGASKNVLLLKDYAPINTGRFIRHRRKAVERAKALVEKYRGWYIPLRVLNEYLGTEIAWPRNGGEETVRMPGCRAKRLRIDKLAKNPRASGSAGSFQCVLINDNLVKNVRRMTVKNGVGRAHQNKLPDDLFIEANEIPPQRNTTLMKPKAISTAKEKHTNGNGAVDEGYRDITHEVPIGEKDSPLGLLAPEELSNDIASVRKDVQRVFGSIAALHAKVGHSNKEEEENYMGALHDRLTGLARDIELARDFACSSSDRAIAMGRKINLMMDDIGSIKDHLVSLNQELSDKSQTPTEKEIWPGIPANALMWTLLGFLGGGAAIGVATLLSSL